MSGRLTNKTAIIIGAGQQSGQTIGNGRAVAERFAQEGADLLLVDIDAGRANATLQAITPYGVKAHVVLADITREEDCQRIIETGLSRLDRIDILHNNVGLSKGDKPTSELDVEQWDAIMDLNLKSMFMTCKYVLPHFRQQGAGCIINISSTSSLSGRPTLAYKTSKGAVNTLTQHLAFENARYGIRANAILPGLMDTPMAIERRAAELGVSRESIREQRNALVPMGTMGTGWDVANASVFLASDEARYITGVLLPVDGGLLVKRG